MNFQDLPEEIHYLILGNLAIWDLRRAAQVCNSFHTAATADSTWQTAYCRSFDPYPTSDVMKLLKATHWPWRDIFRDRLVFEREVLRIDRSIGGEGAADFDSTAPLFNEAAETSIPFRLLQSWRYLQRTAKDRAEILHFCRLLLAISSPIDNYKKGAEYLAGKKVRLFPWWARAVKAPHASVIILRFGFFLTHYNSIQPIPKEDKTTLISKDGTLDCLDLTCMLSALVIKIARACQIANQVPLAVEALEVGVAFCSNCFQYIRDANFLNNYAAITTQLMTYIPERRKRDALFRQAKDLLLQMPWGDTNKYYNLACCCSVYGLEEEAKKWLRASLMPNKRVDTPEAIAEMSTEAYWPAEMPKEKWPLEGWPWWEIREVWVTASCDPDLKNVSKKPWFEELMKSTYRGKAKTVPFPPPPAEEAEAGNDSEGDEEVESEEDAMDSILAMYRVL